MGSFLAKPAPNEPPVGRLTSLSKRIDDNTRILASCLQARGVLAPSFDCDGSADFPADGADEEAQEARDALISMTQELRDLVLGPRDALKYMTWDCVFYISLQAICEFRIAECVPKTGSISYDSLSQKTTRLMGMKLLTSDLRRILRLAISHNIFEEPQPEFIAHNRMSLLFLEDETILGWVGMFTTDLLLPIANTVPAMKRWPGSQESNETGVNFSYNHSLSFFDHLQADAQRIKRYDLAMRANTLREGYALSHTVQSYPWAKFGKATVVDVGGNEGYVSMALAEAFPSLSFIVQDQAGMRTPNTIGKMPPHLTSRIKLTTHDFFTPQPVVAEAYLFRHIFHGFSDKHAVKILRALIPALRPGAHVIVNEYTLPAPGSVSRLEEQSVRTMDVLMQTVCNSRERDVYDWKNLFLQADKRFKWKGAWRSSGRLWFLDVVWEE